jgi:Ca-activated chloride channel family protein
VLQHRAAGVAAASAAVLLSWAPAWPQTPRADGSAPTLTGEGTSQAPDGGDERAAVLGLATFAVEPADARVRLGSLDSIAAPAPTFEPIDPSVPLPLSPGEYLLYAERPGYRPAALTFSVTPGEVAQPAASLERTSAVLKLRLQPPGAKVLIDGRERRGAPGRSGVAPTPSSPVDLSAVWIEGLPPGSHELEIASDGFRSYYASLQVPDLRDVELPAVSLERLRAAVGFPGLPEDATVTAGGLPLAVDHGATPPQAFLAPGRYELAITHGTAGYFEALVLAEDRRRVDVAVRLRPALAFLGVVGGDAAQDKAVRAAMDPFREQSAWLFQDRADVGVDLLRDAGFGGDDPDRAAFGQRLEEVVPAALYLAVELGVETGAARLWWWSAAPGPGRPDARTVPIREGQLDPGVLAELAAALRPSPDRQAPLIGATVIESLASGGFVVTAVESGSPAELAGLAAGMEISGLRHAAGPEFESWEAAVAALRPDDALEVSLVAESGAAESLRVEPVWGWSMLDPFDPELLPTAAAAHLVRQIEQADEDVPAWLLELELGAILLARGDLEQAVGRLRRIQAPRRGGLSQDTVEYILALALTELAEKGRPEYADQAVALFRDLEYAERSRLESDGGPSIAARSRLHAKTSLALVPPRSEIVIGSFRADVLASGTEIVAVRFLVDGKLQTTQTGSRPWAMLRLARYPTQQVIRVEGLNAEGKVVASDELVLNQQRGDLRLQIEAPPEGVGVQGPVEARVSLVVPEERQVSGVEFRVGEQVQAVLPRPPWNAEIAVPAPENVGELIYLTVKATLDDGTSAEDVRILTSSGITENVEVDLVELYTTVVDRANRPVLGLRESDFNVFENGRRQNLAKFELVEDLPLTVGVAIDASASMEDVLDEAKEAAGQFLTRLMKPSDSCFAIAFDTRPQLLAGRTSGVGDVVDTLGDLRATGRTALHDALMMGLYYFRGVRGRRALVLLSDGADTSSSAKYDDVLEYARYSEIVIYTIGLGISRTEPVLQGKLEELAAETGGRAFFIDAARELRPVYREIEQELRSQYLLAYNSNQEGGGDAFRPVEVRVAGGRRARTMSGYYP